MLGLQAKTAVFAVDGLSLANIRSIQEIAGVKLNPRFGGENLQGQPVLARTLAIDFRDWSPFHDPPQSCGRTLPGYLLTPRFFPNGFRLGEIERGPFYGFNFSSGNQGVIHRGVLACRKFHGVPKNVT